MSSRDFRSVPPPPNLNSRTSYTRPSEASAWQRPQQRSSFDPLRRPRAFGDEEDDYFDRDDEDDISTRNSTSKLNDKNDDDEEDPLDAFMADLAKSETKKPSSRTTKNEAPTLPGTSKEKDSKKGVRQDIEEEDNEESYYRYMEENPHAGMGTLASDSDDDDPNRQFEYDSNGNPIAVMSKKMIDPLPVIYHSQIDYPSFEKNFYTEHEEIKKLNNADVCELRRKLNIKVSGPDPPKPCSSFAHFGFDEQLMKVIRKMEYTQPTPIQAQAVPAALIGRDIIGIAKTGSGKTAAFIWPLLVHILDQPQLKSGDGPIGLILAPTRELSQQIFNEAKRFAKPYGIHVVCAYGGGSKYEQAQDLEAGADIVVATPGRMIDFIKMKATNLLRVTFLVLDEADRMFDMGFEPQVRSICNHVRPDRQTLMFSATFKKKIEKLARDVLTDPIRIVQGEVGEANQDITQVVHVFQSGTPQKWDWLTTNLVSFCLVGSVLIFVTKKANAQELADNVIAKTNYKALLLHGDMNQLDRNKVITAFKRQESPILVATDVAARGLDISHIRTVINYDLALNIDTHTHRIGRTGRAGEHGIAYTLVTEKDKEMVGHLVRHLESANQPVPEPLMALALQSAWFRKSRFKQSTAKQISSGGFPPRRARPGLGSKSASTSSSVANSFSTTSSLSSISSGAVGSASSSSASYAAPSQGTPSSSRIATVRAAHKAHFRSQFVSATDTAWTPREEQPPPKKSRWN